MPEKNNLFFPCESKELVEQRLLKSKEHVVILWFLGKNGDLIDAPIELMFLKNNRFHSRVMEILFYLIDSWSYLMLFFHLESECQWHF